MPMLIDAHEDLAYCALHLGRDYRRSAAETRSQEAAAGSPRDRETLLGWPDYQRGQVALIFGTLFTAPRRRERTPGNPLAYAGPEDAHRICWQQLEFYRRLAEESPAMFRQVRSQSELAAHLEEWKEPAVQPEDPDDARPVGHPVGLVGLMEGADGVRGPDELGEWWEAGLRIIGLAWAGTRYSGGTGEPGPLTPEGIQLLEAMAEIGFALDVSHMDAQAALQAAERYPGTVIATHANPLGMMRGTESNRFLPDALIDLLLQRDAVIGAMPVNYFLSPRWKRNDRKDLISLGLFADHIDYYCQRAGDARHVGFGSDFDGGFGRESTPLEVDTIADLQKVAGILASRGYSAADVDAIFSGNWLRKLAEFLPKI